MVDFNYLMEQAIELSNDLLMASAKIKEAQYDITRIEKEYGNRLEKLSKTTLLLLTELKHKLVTIQADSVRLEIIATNLRASLLLDQQGIDTSLQDDEEDYEAPKESE